MPRVIAVIPARMGSSRFPGKPLAPLLGRPMLEHVFRRTAACALVDDVIVATCDTEIQQAVEAFGGRVAMTSPKHERASDRVAEAAQNEQADIIVMVQGDEPMIHPDMIADAVKAMLSDANIKCVNLLATIRTEEEVRDPNTIKVVTARNGDALFFSRQPIPAFQSRYPVEGLYAKQVCVIVFRRETLRQFEELTPTTLEVAESIDMLRFLEHGVPVRMVPTVIDTHAVDTSDDLRRVEELLAADPYTATYMTELAR